MIFPCVPIWHLLAEDAPPENMGAERGLGTEGVNLPRL